MVSQAATAACPTAVACSGRASAEPRRDTGSRCSTSSECLISEKGPAPCSVSRADLVFERFLEEFQRGQIARAQAQAFQVEQLHEGDQAQQRNGDEARRNEHSDHHASARSIRPRRQAQLLAPARFGARHAAAVGFVIHAEQVQQRRAASGCGLPLRWSGRTRGLRTRAVRGDGDVAQPAPTPATGNDSTSVA